MAKTPLQHGTLQLYLCSIQQGNQLVCCKYYESTKQYTTAQQTHQLYLQIINALEGTSSCVVDEIINMWECLCHFCCCRLQRHQHLLCDTKLRSVVLLSIVGIVLDARAYLYTVIITHVYQHKGESFRVLLLQLLELLCL